MKKKVFSLMMMLLLAFTGFVRANELTVHDGTTTNSYVPVYGFYADAYLKCEMVYPASELSAMSGGEISSLTFGISSPASEAWTGTFQVFVKEVNDATISDFSGTTGATVVYTGTLDGTGSTMTVNFSSPYTYNGGNLLVGFYLTTTGNYKSISWAGETVTGASVQGYSYSDLSDITASQRNFLPKTTFTYTGGGGGTGGGGFEDLLHVKYMDGEEEVIDSLNMGVRPAGYWMEPFNFTMYSEGPTYTVNVLDFTPSDGMFSVEGEELPFQVTSSAAVELMLSVNASTADSGVIERQFVAITEGDRAAHIWPVVVELYQPEVPDVWELAYDLGTVTPGFTYAGAPAEITPTVLHNDYTLPFPEIPEGEDGVYKFTVDNDVIISAYVGDGQENPLENGKVALYTEDFYGEGGPMATNNYTGLAAAGGGGAAGAPFEAQIGEGTSTSGYFPFYSLYNYSIAAELFLAAELEEAGVTTAPFTSLSWNATNSISQNQQNITIWMANVPDTQIPATSPLASGMTKVYTGDLNQPTPTGWVEFVFNEGSFSWDGHSNVMILCQRNNGEWTSSIQWQYHNPGFAARGYDYTDNAPYDVTTTAYSWYTSSTTRANIIMKGGNRDRNRDLVDFEDGNMPAGWDASQGYNDWYVDNEDYWGHAPAYSGNYSLYVDGNGNDEEDYFISPALEFAGAGSVSFAYATPSWSGDQNDLTVAYSTSPSGPWTYTSFVYETSEAWTTATVDLSALNGTYYIAFISYDGYGYCTAIDNINITGATSAGGGETPTPTPGPEMEGVSAGPVITNLGLTPGTYYLVASSAVEEEIPQPRVDGGEAEENFFVYINIDEMPCPAIEAEGFAFNPEPADDADDLEPASVTLRWQVPEYATGWRLIFGSTYHPEPGHPQTIMYPEDGSFSTDMANSYTVRNLWNNTNYFWHVEFNNDACPEGVSSPIWGFTTHLNIPQNLTVVDETVFNDETVVLNWTPVVDRTYRFYNVYRDGVVIGTTEVNNISNSTYTDGPLAYNMEGYTYYVTAVYDEGESAPSNTVTVKVSGRGNVNGHVYEQDGTTGIANATVTMVGQDEFGVTHTYNFVTNGQGYYSGAVYAGSYNGSASCNGYQTIYEPVQGNPIGITYNVTTSPVDYILDENFDPVCQVIAEYYPDSLDPNSPYVKVYWGCGLPGSEIIEPFETGDFSLFDWQIDPTYPWTITTNNPYEGTYCMKSGGAGVASVVSNMSVTVDIPADGIMSFFGKISSENNYDYGHFYIDGVEKGQYCGAGSWGEKKFDITQGTHTFKWSYTKDSSVNSNDDCFYVDYITFYKQPEPAQPGWHTYCESEFNNAVGSNLTTTPSWAYEYPASFLNTNYAGWQITKVSLFSDNMYSAVGGNYTCRIYTGGTQPAAGTMVSTITVDVPSNQNAWVDWDLTTPVNVTGAEPIWVVWTANTTVSSWPAGCCGDLNELGTWWDGGNGWEHLTYGTWTMRHWFTNRSGRSVAVGAVADVAPVAVVDNNPINSSLRTFVKGDNSSNAVCANPNAVKGAAMSSDITRSLDHYRVYRTNCYNDGPYTEENTVLLATVWVPDTVYIDVEWADLPAGVYKWGVGAVYSGNRGEEIEGPINWAAPVAVNAPEMTPELYAMTCGLAPQTEQSNVNPMPAVPGMTRGNFAYACNAYGGSNPTGWIKYDIDAPTAGTSLNSGVSVFGGDLAADGYVYATYNDNNWYKIDPLTGSIVSSGSLGMFFVDCAYDYTTDVMYGSYNGSLYTWDLATNTTTLVGSMGGVQSMQMIAVDLDGQMYGIEYSTGNFDAIDKTTGAITVIGSTGYSPAYVQGGGFDHNTGKLYWAGYTSTGIFCEIDKTSGAATLLGNNVGEQLSWCVPYTYTPGPTPGPNPGGNTNNLNQLALPRESETIWSNCLDKDMYLFNDVTVNVLLNSADSPEGVQVNFTNYNAYEQQTYGGYSVTLDESGFYAFDEFRKGEYKVNVTFEGYEPIEDSVSIWEPTDLRYVMTEILYGVENIYVSRTGWAMWDDSHNVPGGGGGGQGGGSGATSFSDDFEAGLGNWTIVDADGDGHNWYHSSLSQTYSCYDYTGWGHNESDGFAVSQSYTDCTYDSYDPNNFMITNQKYSITSSSVLNFWADYGNDSYPDHFGVAVATADNPTPADFTIVWEGSAKSGNAGKSQIRHNGDRYFNWRSHSVDLSAYAGQDVYIAFRHFNSYDQYEIYIDDVELTGGAKSGDRHLEYYKVMCTSIDGVPIFNHNTVHPFCQLSTDEPYNAPLVEGEHYLCKVACMYSTGLGAWSEPVEWVYEPCDHWGPVDEVEVDVNGQGNHVQWVFEHGFNPYGGETPGPGPGTGGAFSVDFEGTSLPEGWTVIDGNNDGYTWCLTSAIPTTWTYYASLTLDWYHSGTNAICSGSYINGVGALNPDEYLVSPQVAIANGSQLSFWVAATDASYPADHFGVFVSDNGTSNWTSVQEWTLTAKGNFKAGDRASRDGNGLRLGNWYNYTVDLSAYAGNKYIAFRHFNCYDQYIMVLDDIELTSGAKSYSAMNSGMVGDVYAFNITDIDNFDERVYFLRSLSKDVRFDVVNGEAAGMFIVSAAAGYENIDLEEAVNEFRYNNSIEFGRMDKVQAADVARAYKAELPMSFTNSMMMDIYAKSRENNMCALADPFCTDNGMYEFPAGVNAGSGEAGPDYDCLYTTPNPAWYYMRIGDPGSIDIYMYSTPAVDIDFCCWGPFDDPTTPCPYGLTEDKVVSCSYSANPTEHCMIPSTAQTGEYYILVITNYSNQTCNINFSAVGGAGSTDCGILPPVDIIGFLITMDGEYLAFAEPTARDYTHEGEFGDHEYCVRPIYPGEMTLPDHNYGWSMGCPVCAGGQGTCAPGEPIHAEALNATDQIKVWWGEENPGPGPGGCEGDEFTVNFESGMPAGWTTIDADGDGNNWTLGSVAMGAGYGHNGSSDLILSKSYDNNSGALHPDNYLVSPAVTLCESSTFTFWACAQDASWAAEHFGVGVSEDGTNFTMVQEWTMTAKGEPYDGPRGTRDQGVWYQYTVNLGDYAGEGRYIAIRHFNCTDMFYLDVDDIELAAGAKNRAGIQKYNVYRATSATGDYTMIGEVAAVAGQTYYEYIDTPEAAGTYYYQVRADYGDCESDPAQAYDEPSHNYVSATVDAVGENSDNVALYPNPTKGNVTIEANGMSRITVVSVLGQVVFDTELDADTYTLNMAQFNAGMYMVRVYTENGVTVKRVTVMQ